MVKMYMSQQHTQYEEETAPDMKWQRAVVGAAYKEEEIGNTELKEAS